MSNYVANKNKEMIREEQLQKVEGLLDTAVSIAKISNITKKEIQEIINKSHLKQAGNQPYMRSSKNIRD